MRGLWFGNQCGESWISGLFVGGLGIEVVAVLVLS